MVAVVSLISPQSSRCAEARHDLERSTGGTLMKWMLAALIAAVLAVGLAASAPPPPVSTIIVDYPSEGSLFPPDIIAPTFQWRDAEQTLTNACATQCMPNTWKSDASAPRKPYSINAGFGPSGRFRRGETVHQQPGGQDRYIVRLGSNRRSVTNSGCRRRNVSVTWQFQQTGWCVAKMSGSCSGRNSLHSAVLESGASNAGA